MSQRASKVPVPVNPAQLNAPFDLLDIAEMTLAFRVDWDKPSQDTLRKSAVGVFRLHKPVDEKKLRQVIEATSTDLRETMINSRQVVFATDRQGNPLFACLISPEILVGGWEGREKLVPG
ncbi:hypothetical protein HRbin36_00764 [bacterium HR36]|nr:hypothetical protein HRbin36_00764 [bacterium HR36]